MSLEQTENIDQVSRRISQNIVSFFGQSAPEFHAEDLRRHIRLNVGMVAPGSPDRIMRDLRAKGRINYRVISRSASKYEILPVGK